ncbi:hypothetical protein C8Q74DRAFT_1225146 [Fomes fomentarius]|nr:hypothetical protein C8Q74DRAFT_1225146 [Fomes fomentarius]
MLLAKLLPAYIVPGYTSSLTLTGGVAHQRPPPGWSVPLRVNLVEPGAVATPLWHSIPVESRAAAMKLHAENSTLGRVGDAEDTAEAYMYLMKDYFATGSIVASNGGMLLV